MLLSFFLPLGIDESYYVLYGRYFDWHYYDHPFMTGLVMKVITRYCLNHEFFYRLPFMIASSISTYLFYKTGKLLGGVNTGFFGAVLFSASLYMDIIAGFFTMPDGMLIMFWTIALYCGIRIFLVDNSQQAVRNEFIIGFGLAVGLALASKLQAVFLWLGFISFAIFFEPTMFKNRHFWLSVLLSSLGCIPMLIWNANNEWVHFTFYKNRVGVDTILGSTFFIREIMGEIFYQNPLVFGIILYFGFFRFNWGAERKKGIFLLLFSLPLLVFIWSVALFKETLPHWSGPSFLALILLGSLSVNQHLSNGKRVDIHRYAVGFLFVVLITGAAFINFYPGTIGKSDGSRKYGQGDFTLDLYGWNNSGKAIAQNLKLHGMDSLPIFADNWFPASHFDEYLSRHSANKVFGVGALTRIHQYHWINQRRGGVPQRDSAIFISASNYPSSPTEIYREHFSKIQCIDSVSEFRSGQRTRYFHVFLMTGKRSN